LAAGEHQRGKPAELRRALAPPRQPTVADELIGAPAGVEIGDHRRRHALPHVGAEVDQPRRSFPSLVVPAATIG
jgi:hypothetical protein